MWKNDVAQAYTLDDEVRRLKLRVDKLEAVLAVKQDRADPPWQATLRFPSPDKKDNPFARKPVEPPPDSSYISTGRVRPSVSFPSISEPVKYVAPMPYHADHHHFYQ
jgi:hypothetical protein